MKFKHYNNLQILNIVARHGSFSSAAEELNLTKGAVSHQIKQLESELGFEVFKRLPRGIKLTSHGQELLLTSRVAFEGIDQRISELQSLNTKTLTIGVTTYFASRWLSPRLMNFMRSHPDIRLRLQPMIDLLNLKSEGVDLAIRWGNGNWSDVKIEKLFPCPAWPCGDKAAYKKVQDHGIEKAFSDFTLLRDRDDSNAWSHWYQEASIPFRVRSDTLIIPDPNVRVQAIIDGQGIALNDDLVSQEIKDGKLFRLSPIESSDYGYYLAYDNKVAFNPELDAFINWLRKSI